MKRKAILIEASNVDRQSEIPGARVDIQNWNNYLQSELGGSWSSSEIVVLRKPYSGDLEAHLKVDADCYCFVAFSGHGCEGSVVLNEHWTQFPIAMLKPKTKQGTLIVDSCRGVEEARIYSLSAKMATATLANELNESTVIRNSMNGRITEFMSAARGTWPVNNHRSLWWDALRKSNSGVVHMSSCAKGQAAGEDPKAGGLYTSLLLQSAEKWQAGSGPSAIHTTKDAHDFAAKRLPQQQTPEYAPADLAFPFGVKV